VKLRVGLRCNADREQENVAVAEDECRCGQKMWPLWRMNADEDLASSWPEGRNRFYLFNPVLFTVTKIQYSTVHCPYSSTENIKVTD